jgi:hypothetical protein
MGEALAERLVGCPLGFVILPEGRLGHRPGSVLHPEDVVGEVVAATATDADVQAVVRVDVERVRQGLMRPEADGQLMTLGVSPVADVRYVVTANCGRPVRRVTAVDRVLSLDAGSRPSGDGFLRSVAVAPATS